MSFEFKRILFATDLSRNSYFAFERAVALSKVSGAEIHMLHVVEPLSDDAKTTIRMFIQDPAERATAIKRRIEPVREEMKERQDKFWSEVSEGDRGLRERVASIDIIEGYPAEEILRRAEEKGCDVIIMGAHEHGISHTFLGSTAKRVLRRSRIPTLIVPHKNA